ncbi:MAG: DUF4271 domain-containing protein [Reichenbachiella sp.]|uniref:DUF4271 domain-containing protein n=1 Tax=Reichenbachiella sp. TaxID=2184521 RepID=UPI003264F62C
MRKYLLFLLLIHHLDSVCQPEKDLSSDVELLNLRWDWEVYDAEIGHYTPYYNHTKTSAIFFALDLNKYRKSSVKLTLPVGCFVWLDQQLVYHSMSERPIYWSLDSLYNIYDKNKLEVTIFSSQFNDRSTETKIVTRSKSNSAVLDEVLYKKRNSRNRSGIFILISILTLSVIAVFRTSHYRLFQEFFSIDRAFRARQNFDLIIAKSPMAWPNIGFIGFYALLIGSSFVSIRLYQPDFDIKSLVGLTTENNLLLGLAVSSYCFVFMLLKLVLIAISSELFKINKIRLVHFYTYFRLSLIIAIVIFTLSIINGILNGDLIASGWSVFKVAVVLLWSVRLLLIFFVLNKIYTFRKLHLFSYLCSTELIPLLLFFKIFLK